MATEVEIIEPGALAAVPTAQLYEELRELVTVTARTIARMAVVWRELEARGEDLSRFRAGLMAYLPAVAAGTLVPEAVVRLAGAPMVLTEMAKLPLEVQESVLADGVCLASSWQGRKVQTTTVPVDSLTREQVRLVFGGGKLRTPEQQRRMMSEVAPQPQRDGKRFSVSLSDPDLAEIRAYAAARKITIAAAIAELAIKAVRA